MRDRKSTRLNSSHTVIYTLSLHDALPILSDVARHFQAVGCQRLFHAELAALAIGVSLSEVADAPVALAVEVADQRLGLLPVGGPDIENELVVGRFPLRFRSGEWRHVHDVFALVISQER